MDMELDTVQWTGNQCRIAGTFTFFVKNFIETGEMICSVLWTELPTYGTALSEKLDNILFSLA